MKVIVGLGNPGLDYYFTRHNAGFAVVDEIGRVDGSLGASFANKKNLFCDMSKIALSGDEIILVKPITYMNDSGKSVQAVLNWYKLASSDLLVVHDDVSLPLGRIRVQAKGGAGGQHGVESIIQQLGGQDFDRVKVGVGPDPGGDIRGKYVLQVEPNTDLYKRSIKQAAEAAVFWLQNGAVDAANKFNGIDLSTT
jgi:peptidyl-tRNA hydrolase, PTH1 family